MSEATGTTDGASLRLRGVAVGAGGRRLLGGIDLELRPGELVGILGPSGSGKTTLLRAIAGLDDPWAGEVELSGRCPEDLRWPCYRRLTVLVDQRPVLFAGTVRENLRRPFRYRTAGSAYAETTAVELLRRLLLPPERLDQEARSLSQGEQQRVCLARALLIEPVVLLLDEPTSALDEDAALAAEAVIRAEARRRGLACLVVTHSRDQARRWCDRVIELGAYREDGA